MGRTKTPLLSSSLERVSALRCMRAIDWISRRLAQQVSTHGRIEATGKGDKAQWSIYGSPLITLPVISVIRETGLNGVSANTDAINSRIIGEWELIEAEWRHLISQPLDHVEVHAEPLVQKTNEWLDRTLHPIERRKLQAYLRQRKHYETHSEEVIQIPVPKDLYSKLMDGVPHGLRKTYIVRILKWALNSNEAKDLLLAKNQ